MEGNLSSGQTYRFGPFVLDVRAGELRKHGIRIGFQEQPLRILEMLLGVPGQPVLREDIKQKLWPNNTMVEFDHGINAAIKRLRAALGDSAETPKYVETVARRGYRFIAKVEVVGQAAERVEPVEPALDQGSGEWDPTNLVGKTVNHYRVLGRLGSGGMGVVYRAEDTRLGRQVALKFLPCAAADAPAQILDRFRREAQAAAALNHPQVCAVYSVEEVSGQPMIVMELVQGQTLADHLARGPLPPRQILTLGAQLARGLDAGHRLGIVHRDLKPANIMLSGDTLKVVDFGLASMKQAAKPDEETVTTLTQAGMIMGTLNYLSPEQAQGKEADERSDIFAFGLVLYEMATGKKAFDGPNKTSVIAAILERPAAPLSTIMPGIRPDLDRLVAACLMKDPAERLQSLHDAALQLEWMKKSNEPETPAAGVRRKLPWGIAGAATLALAVTAVATWNSSPRPPTPSAPVQLLIDAPGGQVFRGGLAISPDGSKLVAVVADQSNTFRLWVRSLSTLASQILTDSEGVIMPFWSPDSKSIGFFAHEKLKTIAATGGPARSLSDALRPAGGAWNADNTILYCKDLVTQLFRIPATGGEPQPVTRLGLDSGHRYPSLLPDGRQFLFQTSDSNGQQSIFLGGYDSGKPRLLVADATMPQVATPNQLLFRRANGLMAQRFNLGSGRLSGEPVPVVTGADGLPANVGSFSVSSNGFMAYRIGFADGSKNLVWRGRDGALLGMAGQPSNAAQVFLSADEKQVSMPVAQDGMRNIWRLQLDTSVLSQLTFEDRTALDPVWSPDGRRLVYQSYLSVKTKLWIITLGEHSPKTLLDDGRLNFPDDWSRDGKWILCRRINKKNTTVFLLSPDGAAPSKVLLDAPYLMDQLQLSPDNQWVAYNSVESGQWQVYIARFPSFTDIQQISNTDGCQPIWRKDGKELFYLTGKGQLTSVSFTPGDLPRPGAPTMLFQSIVPACSTTQYAVGGNGEKFLVLEPAQKGDAMQAREPIHVVINWQSGLPR